MRPALKLLAPIEPLLTVLGLENDLVLMFGLEKDLVLIFGLEKVLALTFGLEKARLRTVFGLEKVLADRLVDPEPTTFGDRERAMFGLTRATLVDETLALLVARFLCIAAFGATVVCVPALTFCLNAGFRFHTFWLRFQFFRSHHGWYLRHIFAL
jgi:hypothetical protein